MKLIPALVLLAIGAVSMSCGGSGATTTVSNSTLPPTTEVVGSTPFTSAEGGFKVTLPAGYGTPKENKNEQTGWTIYLSSGSQGNTCAVGFRPISEEIANSLDTPEKKQEALEIFRDDSLKGMQVGGMNITSDKQENITVEGRPGLSVDGTATTGGSTRYFRITNILANTRAYRISCFSMAKENLDKPEIQAFFRS